MAARVCSECGGLVASSISVCPHCGHFVGQPTNNTQQNPGMNTNAQFGGAYNNCAMPNNHFVPNPHNNILWTILAFFLFWPCAIGALIYYIKSDQAWNNSNAGMAQHYAMLSSKWGKASIWLIVTCIIFLVALAGCAACYDY